MIQHDNFFNSFYFIDVSETVRGWENHPLGETKKYEITKCF